MITIAKRVEQLIEQWPMLRQGLELELLNSSSVARYLKPEIEKGVGERISEAAVLMAIRRYEQKSKKIAGNTNPSSYLGDITVRNNLIDITYTNSPSLSKTIARLAHAVPASYYFTSSRGLNQTSIILNSSIKEQALKILEQEHLEQCVENLAAISLSLKQRHDPVPGILAYILQQLAWRGIPVIEVVSTYDEFHTIIYKKDVEEAFSTLNQAINC
jgi:aspartokinase